MRRTEHTPSGFPKTVGPASRPTSSSAGRRQGTGPSRFPGAAALSSFSGRADRTPYCYHMVMARTQTLVQLSDDLLTRLDARRGREGRSRSELVRDAIERYLAEDREAEIDRLIVEAYTRLPPESTADDAFARRMIADEPW